VKGDITALKPNYSSTLLNDHFIAIYNVLYTYAADRVTKLDGS
jgi:hypothetical protein